ncbi:hypothetical protein PFICI_11109 [Pestalotiopsis fici W106-1]|uniref:WW domain-containing protein n=1 Tax=Pestalotiopsis fici (strain W106-1 / CGMCC3.15140) TaxID=1229662 RepID=W3WTR6_PESFW|nr:uncharacterized protein PFICI_11109 [Pestalotiopsis fici W106-1]ETS77235.1 hypothetical protein PFICI_11109 [Pestalotiopsis fici W106-1]
MTSLAPGWEADYDGSRWFYRYKSTGLTQYTFPKAGDEFPEHIGAGSESFGLAPEERLASDRQVKKRGSSDSPQTQGPTEVVGGMSATGYFDPLAWHDDFSTSPELEAPATSESKDTGPTSRTSSTVPSLTATPTAAAPAVLADGSSPKAGELRTDDESGSVSAVVEEENDVHMLDGQPIYQELPATTPAHMINPTPSSPVGKVAELASSDTVKCADELAPIEMDGASSIPGFFGTHVNPYTPAELPNEEMPMKAQQANTGKTSPGALQANPSDPPGSQQRSQLYDSGAPAGLTNDIKAWKPAARMDVDADYPRPLSLKSSAANIPGTNISQSRNSELTNTGPKRHSVPATVPSSSTSVQRHPTVLTPAAVPKTSTTLKSDTVAKGPLRSPIPSILRPARGIASKYHVPIPGTNARHGSIQAEAQPHTANPPNPAMTHVPSVLKPAGRKMVNGHHSHPLHPARPENRPRAESLEAQPHRASFSTEKIYQRRPVSMLIDQKSASFGFERLSVGQTTAPGPSTLQYVSELHGDMMPPRPSTTTPDQSRRDPNYSTTVPEPNSWSKSQTHSGQLAELPATVGVNYPIQGLAHSDSSAQEVFDISRPTSTLPSEVSSPTVSMLSVHHTPKLAHSQVVNGTQANSSSHSVAVEENQTHEDKDHGLVSYVTDGHSEKVPCSQQATAKKVDTNVEVAPIYTVADSKHDTDAVSMLSDREWPRAVIDYSGDSWGDEW